jgi:hypothetical protein
MELLNTVVLIVITIELGLIYFKLSSLLIKDKNGNY